MRSARLLAAVVLAAIPLSAGPAFAADAPWSVEPADNAFGPDRQNYSYTVAPGEKVDDELSIVNRGSAALELAVYAADGFTTESGQLDLRRRGFASTGVGAWVRPAVDHVTIPPGQAVSVPFTLTVPRDAAPGDHVGGIVTSVKSSSSEERMGVRIRLRVGGELKPQLTVSDVQVHPPLTGGDATVTYTVHNTGNATVAARQKASLTGPFGQLRASSGEVADSPALLPGDQWKATVPVRGVAAMVPLTADVTVVPLLTDAAGSTSQLTPVDADAHARILPLVVVVAVLLLVVAALIIRRPKPKRLPAG